MALEINVGSSVRNLTCFLAVSLFWTICNFAGSAISYGQNGLNQAATVFIRVECEDEKSGAIAEPIGSGFIVDEAGYIVTAHHVVSCLDPNTQKQAKLKAILVRLGSPKEPPDREAVLIKTDEQSDVAVLRISGAPRNYPTLTLCSLWNPAAGLRFMAAGFPEGREYQPVEGIIGNTGAEGGRWSAASPFASGMSGGPVVHKGSVIGIVKGGAREIAALRTITPIHKAKYLLETETRVVLRPCVAAAQFESIREKENSEQESEEKGNCNIRVQGVQDSIVSIQGGCKRSPPRR